MRKNYDTPSLPEHCYAVLPNSGQLIEVRRGEMGYYPCAYSTGGRAYNQVLENYFNAHEGISKAQAAAMLAGSMFGWSVPAADPSRYDLNGEPVRPGVRKALPRSPQYLYEQAKLLREEYAPGTKVILDEAVNTPTMMHPQAGRYRSVCGRRRTDPLPLGKRAFFPPRSRNRPFPQGSCTGIGMA